MRPNSPSPTGSVVLHELPSPESPQSSAAHQRDQVVFVTNAVRRRGGLRSRSDQRRPVLAVVVR